MLENKHASSNLNFCADGNFRLLLLPSTSFLLHDVIKDSRPTRIGGSGAISTCETHFNLFDFVTRGSVPR